MHSPHFMRRLAALSAGAILCLLASAANAAAPLTLASARGKTVTVARQDAPSPAAARPTSPAAIQSGPWQQLGPFNTQGRVQCVAPHELAWPIIDVGSDGNGYWTGYGFGDYSWDPRAPKLGTGVEQMSIKLVFLPDYSYFERRSIVGTDGSLQYSDDDGATWLPVTLNLNDGRTWVPGGARLATSDKWSNVVYLLARIYEPSYDDTLYMFTISFDSGASFDEMRFLPSRVADLWVSRNGDGRMALAFQDDDGNARVMIGSQDDFNWTDFVAPAPSSGGSIAPGITVTAQSFLGVVDHVWVMHGDGLFRTTDGGETWSNVRPAFPMGGPRGLCASIYTPDLLVWTDLERAPDFSRTYWSTDGGETRTEFWQDNWPGNRDHMSEFGTNIDVLKWDFGTSPALRTRQADGTTATHATPARALASQRPAATQALEERFYISSGTGLHFFTPGDTLAPLLTGFEVCNAELSDVASLRGTDEFDTYTTTRDWGLLRTYHSWGPECDGFRTVWSSAGNYVSDIVTNYGPRADDFTYWVQFPDNLALIAGGGPFSGAYSPGGATWAHHRLMVSDPASHYAFYFGSDQLYHGDWSGLTNTITFTPVVTTLALAHGGVTGFAIAPSDANRWYLALTDGSLATSEDQGLTWSIGAGTAPDVMDADQLERVKMLVNPYDPLEAWCVGAGIVHTSDGGAQWETAEAGLPPGNTLGYDVAYDGTPLNEFYLAAASGPWRWSAGTWVSLTHPDLPAVQFRAVEAIPYRGRMRFATWGSGIWDYATGNPLDAPPSAVAMLELSPRQNPVRGMTAIDYALPRAGHVTLELLDVAGRRVATLVDGTRPAGRASAGFDAASMGAGVYFARLRSVDGARTTKLVVTH